MTKTVTVREQPWDPQPRIEVQLKPTQDAYGDEAWTVWQDAECLGIVGHYMGSMTIKIPGTRLIRHGKRRKFWFARTPDSHWTNNDLPSRAEAIRYLVHA